MEQKEKPPPLKIKKRTFDKRRYIYDTLDLLIGDSHVRDSISFEYKSPNDFGNFNKLVKRNARLDSSVISSKDLQVFAPQLYLFDDKWNISGNVKGIVNNFSIRNLELKFGKKSVLQGYTSFEGFPDVAETVLDLKFKKSKTHAHVRLSTFVKSKKIKAFHPPLLHLQKTKKNTETVTEDVETKKKVEKKSPNYQILDLTLDPFPSCNVVCVMYTKHQQINTIITTTIN